MTPRRRKGDPTPGTAEKAWPADLERHIGLAIDGKIRWLTTADIIEMCFEIRRLQSEVEALKKELGR